MYDDFLRTKLLYRKVGGTMICHMVQSFPAGEEVDPVTAHAAARGESWKFRLMNTVDACMRFVHSREAFIALIRGEGYDVRWTDSCKIIAYTTSGGMKRRDDRLHAKKYLKERMEIEFRIPQAREERRGLLTGV